MEGLNNPLHHQMCLWSTSGSRFAPLWVSLLGSAGTSIRQRWTGSSEAPVGSHRWVLASTAPTSTLLSPRGWSALSWRKAGVQRASIPGSAWAVLHFIVSQGQCQEDPEVHGKHKLLVVHYLAHQLILFRAWSMLVLSFAKYLSFLQDPGAIEQ